MGAKRVEKKDKKEASLQQNQRLWNKEEAREFLQLPMSTFNLYLAKGDIPALKIGKHVRFLPDQLMAWAKKQTA